MANPINPATGRPWTDQEMAYFRLLDQNKGDANFQANADKYLTHVAKVNPETGNSRYLQGLDPYQQRGGIDWAQYALQADIARQAADMARQSLGFQKGSAVGWVDGKRTLEGVMRDDDIRRNPMNAAIYEQERRGFRADGGNMNPDQYMNQNPVGDEAPKSGGGAPGGGGGGNKAPKAKKKTGGMNIKLPSKQKSAPRTRDEATEAFYNPRTNQYEFATKSGAPRFSIDRNTGADLSGGDRWAQNRGTGDDRVAVGTDREVDKGSMSRAVKDLNKRIKSMSPEAAKAFADYDRSRGVPGATHGEEFEVPGYDGRALPTDAYGGLGGAFNQYMADIVGKNPGMPINAKAQQDKFAEAMRRIAALQKDIDETQRAVKEGRAPERLGLTDKDYMSPLTPEQDAQRQRLGRVQQMLNIDWKSGKDKGLLQEGSYNPDRNQAYNFFMKEVMRMQPYGTGLADTLNAYKQYTPWLQELYDPMVETSSTPAFADGGGMRLGGAPHWITDRFMKPVAAITEDGKDEVVKGKGGIEVVPTDPSRKKNYLSRKKGDKNAISHNTTMHGARRKSAKPGDGRANNGTTNNGRDRLSAKPANKTRGVGGRDAMSIQPAPGGTPMPMGDVSIPEVNGGAMGNATMPVPTPNGLIPYRPVAPGLPMMRPLFSPVRGAAGGAMLPAGAYGGLGGASNDFVRSGKGSADDFASIMRGERPYMRTQTTQRSFRNGQQVGGQRMSQEGNRVSIQPFGAPTTMGPTSLDQPRPGFTPEAGIPGMPKMDASGGNRIIGNETAPTARYGFDKNAPIDIAARPAVRGVKGSPGVQVAQPWKHAPRALLQRGKFGNQLLQSYWNATGGASEDLADRGAAAAPRAATSGRSFY